MEALRKSDCVIHVLDDDSDLLESLEFALTSEGWVVKTYNEPSQLLMVDANDKPGCLLLDIQMPKMNGLEVQQYLAEHNYPYTIVFMSNYGTMDTAIHAFRKGAFDFLKKPIAMEELFETVEKAVRKDMERKAASHANSPGARFATLSERERQVSKDLAQDLPSQLIAEHLGISTRTLERHRQNVFRKLGVSSGRELRAFLKQVR